jgi:hypothetical protein
MAQIMTKIPQTFIHDQGKRKIRRELIFLRFLKEKQEGGGRSMETIYL